MLRSSVLTWGALATSSVACSAHRASMPAGYAQLPTFAEPGEAMLAVAVTPIGQNAVTLDLRLGGRLSEHVSLDFVTSTALHDDFDPLLPGLQVALETTLIGGPLRLDLSAGMTQSSFFVAARAGVAHELRWEAGRWGVRVAADGFGSLPSSGCGEFVSCPDGPTRSTVGAEASLAFGARMAGSEVALGPRITILSAGGAPVEVVYGLVLQLEGRMRVDDMSWPLAAPTPSP